MRLRALGEGSRGPFGLRMLCLHMSLEMVAPCETLLTKLAADDVAVEVPLFDVDGPNMPLQVFLEMKCCVANGTYLALGIRLVVAEMVFQVGASCECFPAVGVRADMLAGGSRLRAPWASGRVGMGRAAVVAREQVRLIVQLGHHLFVEQSGIQDPPTRC